tara:strand:+ start:446 stop:850 length:405 start_codon:yes stop_codon:yes gene_type:complete
MKIEKDSYGNNVFVDDSHYFEVKGFTIAVDCVDRDYNNSVDPIEKTTYIYKELHKQVKEKLESDFYHRRKVELAQEHGEEFIHWKEDRYWDNMRVVYVYVLVFELKTHMIKTKNKIDLAMEYHTHKVKEKLENF